jgi:hypothetical protein
MYSCACSFSSNPIDLYTVIKCECWQIYPGRTALLWASERGHAETVRVFVELGASLEAVDTVNIHAHALAHTCCIKAVSGIMRMTMIIMTHAYVYMHIYTLYVDTYVCICDSNFCLPMFSSQIIFFVSQYNSIKALLRRY